VVHLGSGTLPVKWVLCMFVCCCVQPANDLKDEDIDGTALEDVDGIPLEEIDGMPLDGEPVKDKTDDDVNGIPIKSIVPYGDDIDGEPGTGIGLWSLSEASFICYLRQ